jgi:hypothetical protein
MQNRKETHKIMMKYVNKCLVGKKETQKDNHHQNSQNYLQQ